MKVKIGATAICHSDVLLVRGDWGGKTPVVAGHVAAGLITEVGADVTSVQPGDRVVVSLLRSCGHCYFCSGGRPYDCEAKFPIDSENRLRNRAGAALSRSGRYQNGVFCGTRRRRPEPSRQGAG